MNTTPRIFKDENEFLDEFYQVMVRNPKWVMRVGLNKRVLVQPDDRSYEICPIMAVQLANGEEEEFGLGAYSGRQLFGETKEGLKARNAIITGADFSSEQILYMIYDDEAIRTHHLQIHDRLIRMSKEFEQDRTPAGLILS